MGNEDGYIILRKSELISLEFKKDEYYESHLVAGSIKIETNSDMIIDEVNIKIRMLQSFIIDESKDKSINNFFQEDILTKKLNLPRILNLMNYKYIKISPGTHLLPFQFFLPKDIPPSFEYPREKKKSFIRYIFTAELKSGKETYITEEYLYIKQRPFMNYQNNRFKDLKIIKTIESISKGESSINLFLPSDNIKINNPIKFMVDIDNTKCGENIENICLKVKRLVTFKKDDKLYTYKTKIINKEYQAKCLKGEKKSFNYEDTILRDNDLEEMKFKDKLNPYLGKITDLNLLMPSLKTPIIRCEYKLKVFPKYESKILKKDRPTIYIPIFAVHQLELEYEGDKIIIEGQKNNIVQDYDQYKVIYNFNGGNINTEVNNNYVKNPYLDNQNAYNYDYGNNNNNFPIFNQINRTGQNNSNQNGWNNGPQIDNPYDKIFP